MRKLLLVTLALLAVHTALLFAGGRGVTDTNRPGATNVGIVLDVGGRGDKSFNDGAYAGADSATKILQPNIMFIEPGEGSDREAGLRLLASENMDLVIGVGFIFSDDITVLAKEYPEVSFACVDYALSVDAQGNIVAPPPNLAALKFREEEGSFLVGALAALVGKSKRVGFVGGMDIPLIHKFEAGYRAGVKHVCPDCTVVAQYAGVTPDAFKNPGKGKELALSQYQSGVNVIFHASGSTGQGVFEAARVMKKLAIGVDADQHDEAPGYILTSMVKGVDAAVFNAIERVQNKTFKGGVYSFGLAEGGVGYVYDDRNKGLIPDSVHTRVEALKQDIIAGRIRGAQHQMTGLPIATANRGQCAIRMTGIDKTFGSVRANRGASLEVMPGEIHALVGENGAGKSTLMKILGGLQKPDAGTMEVNGTDVTGWSTSDAIAAGIGVVHQHFMLVPTLTVAENIILGMEPVTGGRIDYPKAIADVQALSRETGLTVSAEATVANLSVGEAQRVEILKTLYRGARILVLDEPTAVLSPPEVRELWTVLRRLRDAGGTIVLITHRLDEVIDVSDTITVMRAGQTVDRLKTADTTPALIARSMVGRDVVLTSRTEASALGIGVEGAEVASPVNASTFHPSDDMTSAIRVTDLIVLGAQGTRAVDGVTFSIRPGEILGIAGVEGNGQTELIEALSGLRPVESGLIRMSGHDVTHKNVSERRDGGLSHIPEDRHRRGLVLDYSIADNLVLGIQETFAKRGILSRERIEANAQEQIESFDIRPPSSQIAARNLSGGNQQKVVIAREMGRTFSILLASQPTRGVDVGAIEFIHSRLREARADGKAILLVSAELNEVLALADRVAVMYRGKMTKVMRASEATEESLGEYMMGTRSDTAA